jgi:hypothetical protein
MAEHTHNPNFYDYVTGCPGCDEAIAKMSPVERAMRDLRNAANKFHEAWDWNYECLLHLGTQRTGAAVILQSEQHAEAMDRELGEAAERYAAAVMGAKPATSITDLTDDMIANWAAGFLPIPHNASSIKAHATYMAIEIQRRRASGKSGTGTVLDPNTRDVITAIIAAKDQQGAWLEATALRTLLGLVDRAGGGQ